MSHVGDTRVPLLVSAGTQVTIPVGVQSSDGLVRGGVITVSECGLSFTFNLEVEREAVRLFVNRSNNEEIEALLDCFVPPLLHRQYASSFGSHSMDQ